MCFYQEWLDFSAVTQNSKAKKLVRQNNGSSFPTEITDNWIQPILHFHVKMNWAALAMYQKQIKSLFVACCNDTYMETTSFSVCFKLSFKENMKMWLLR